MNTQLANVETGEIVTHAQGCYLSQEVIKTLFDCNVIPKDTPPSVVAMFGQFCKETGLNPIKRQVHLIRRGNKFTIQTGIDGYRSIANKTGLYAGNDDYRFNDDKSEYELIKSGDSNPITATATVHKIVAGQKVSFSATASWNAYKQEFEDRQTGEMKLGNLWAKMPFLMLGKCAEALALRKAFPDELGGIYTDEEMAQANHATDVKYAQVVEEPTNVVTEGFRYPRPNNKNGWTRSDKQKDRLLAIITKEAGLSVEAGRDWMEVLFGVTSSQDLSKESYDYLCDYFFKQFKGHPEVILGELVAKHRAKTGQQTLDVTPTKEEIIAKGDKAAEELHG